MTFTQFGRVELDITKVPDSAMGTRQGGRGDPRIDRFEARLEEVSRSRESHRPDTHRGDTHRPDTPGRDAGSATDTSRRSGTVDAEQNGAATGADPSGTMATDPDDGRAVQDQDGRAPADTTDDRAAAANRAPATGDGKPGTAALRGLTAAAGGDSTGSDGTRSPAWNVHAQVTAEVGAQQALPGQPAQPAQGNTLGLGEAQARVAADALLEGGSLKKTSATPAGPRTMNGQFLEAAEAARDSVIKQIAMKLGRDGGEMRVQLDPPELGRLDLRMLVEKGAVVQLSIAAERPEVAAMLGRHMADLRAALASQGLDLAQADVQTGLFQQSGAGQDRHGRGAHGHRHADAGGNGELEPTGWQRQAGWITAEGLDFWV